MQLVQYIDIAYISITHSFIYRFVSCFAYFFHNGQIIIDLAYGIVTQLHCGTYILHTTEHNIIQRRPGLSQHITVQL